MRCSGDGADEVRIEMRALGQGTGTPAAPADGEFHLTIEYWTQSYLA